MGIFAHPAAKLSKGRVCNFEFDNEQAKKHNSRSLLPMKEQVIAVLDIGKTNKKVLVYNMQLQVQEQVSAVIGEVTSKAGLKLEQPEVVYSWFCQMLSQLSQRFDIVAISVTTHGAMGVCLDEHGNITCPPLAYTNEPGGDFDNSFYQRFGSRAELQRQTATAQIGEMVNFAKMIFYWNEYYPDLMAQTKHILMYPQYFGYKLTGQIAAEPTMLGCHSYLYDHENNTYSGLALELGVADKLPARIANSWEVLGVVTPEIVYATGINPACVVTIGVHDSNSSLLPYLLTQADDFVLNSTGTWCVVMKQSHEIAFDQSEIGKTVFYNQNVFNRPVKTSVFMGGLEYETYMGLLRQIHGRSDLPALDDSLYGRLFDSADCFILPSVVKGAGMFPDMQARVVDNGEVIPFDRYSSNPALIKFFADYEMSVAVLTASLVMQTYCAMEAAGYSPGDKIFVEGGFRHNQPYLQLLTAMCPGSEVYTTDIEQATALGAALLALAALQCESPDELGVALMINKLAVNRPDGFDMIESYRQKFLSLVQMEGSLR